MADRAIDIISPVYVGEDKISITVAEESKPLLALRPITVNIDYSGAGTDGITLPLRFIVQPGFGEGGPAGGYIEKIFRRDKPTSYTFTPIGAGDYLILIKETGHNRWQGRLVVTVGGDQFSTVETER